VKQFCIQVWTRQQQLLMRQEKKNIDMIVLGRHGRKGLLKALMGEVCSKGYCSCTLQGSGCPKSSEELNTGLSLLQRTDLEHSIAAVEEAINIAKRCGSRILALSSSAQMTNCKGRLKM